MRLQVVGGKAPAPTEATSVVGARLITRMLRDLGRERGVRVDDIVWLPDPEKWAVETYVLAVTVSGLTRRQIFPREDLATVVESDLMRRRVVTALMSVLGASSIWHARRRSASDSLVFDAVV